MDGGIIIFEALSWLTPQQINSIPNVSKNVRTSFNNLSTDPLHWKRRIENLYNSGNSLLDRNIGLDGWRGLYYELEKTNGKWRELIYHPVNENYMRIAIEIDEEFGTIANIALQNAAKYNYVSLVKDLLDDGRANPGNNNNYALYLAVGHNNDEAIKLLLNDSRVDPLNTVFYVMSGDIAEYGSVLWLAARNLNYKLVELFLKNYNFTTRMIILAARGTVGAINNNVVDIAKMLVTLITDARVNTYQWISDTWNDLLDSYTDGIELPYEYNELFNLLLELVKTKLTDKEYSDLIKLLNK